MILQQSRVLGDLLILPCETIKEVMESHNITKEELISKSKMPPCFIEDVLSGKNDITGEVSYMLESVLDVPQSFWLNIQKKYDEEYNQLVKQKEHQREDTSKYHIAINGVSFYYGDDITLTEEIIRELAEFSEDRYLEYNSYVFYYDDETLVIY